MANRNKNIPLPTVSPTNGKRGCLCKDEITYSIECCDGSLWAQGIGNISQTNIFIIQEKGSLILLEDNGKIIVE